MRKTVAVLILMLFCAACSWAPPTYQALTSSPATSSDDELVQNYYALNAAIRQAEKGGNGGANLQELETQRDAIRREMARRNRDLVFPVTIGRPSIP